MLLQVWLIALHPSLWQIPPLPATFSWIEAAMDLFDPRKSWLLLEFSLFRFLYILSSLMVFKTMIQKKNKQEIMA